MKSKRKSSTPKIDADYLESRRIAEAVDHERVVTQWAEAEAAQRIVHAQHSDLPRANAEGRSMRHLSLPQLALLREASTAADGTVRARGFGCALHATVTARALQERGLVSWMRDAMGGGGIYRITDAGRAAYTAALDPTVTCGHLPCMVLDGHPAKRLVPHVGTRGES
jgi:hypothetical protein